MLTINPEYTSTRILHSYLLGSVGPRPIAFASTVDKDGVPNLAPFSFFNVFSASPPILIFSPARSGRTKDTKHTYQNIKEVPEVVINVVTYDMVQQMNLASSEFPKGVNEFKKAGFTEIFSLSIKPKRIKESPIQLECKVRDVVELGTEGGAGNLIICELTLLHIDESFLDDKKKIDQRKLDLVGRLGGDFYVRAHGDALFEMEKPGPKVGMGIDNLPLQIKRSKILTGNDLGKLALFEKIPTEQDLNDARQRPEIKAIMDKQVFEGSSMFEEIQKVAQQLLSENRVAEAWSILMI